ncbi:MAG: hypothetical protein E2O76_00500 [Caldithrix sp.]|nr:MAG: hypothetical protein E2O76_00500 [Caldithrix sp.]
MTGAAASAFRATDVENALTGKALDEQTISDATVPKSLIRLTC